MIRHFVSTGYVVHGDSILLHWHKKVKEWIPAGGHIEPNEDPIQAVIREVFEETGIKVSVAPVSTLRGHNHLHYGNLEHLEPPVTILLERVRDESFGPHEHIDFVYFTVPVGIWDPDLTIPVPSGWIWVSARQLSNRTSLTLPNGRKPPDDVISLGLMAIELCRDLNNSHVRKV